MSKRIVIDLNDYTITRKHPWGWYHTNEQNKTYAALDDRDMGLKAAKDFKLTKVIPMLEFLELKLAEGTPTDDTFFKAFLGPSARKIGPENLKKLIGSTNQELRVAVIRYLNDEQERINKRAMKKAEEKAPAWSSPREFFIPDIGTKFRLTEDWHFTLWSEYRNSKLLELIGLNSNRYWGRNQERLTYPVTIRAGAILTVDRIYIRKGVSGYSSLTFNLKKGSKVFYLNTDYDCKGVRFWAKLSDVNKLVGEFDLRTLPGSEEQENDEEEAILTALGK